MKDIQWAGCSICQGADVYSTSQQSCEMSQDKSTKHKLNRTHLIRKFQNGPCDIWWCGPLGAVMLQLRWVEVCEWLQRGTARCHTREGAALKSTMCTTYPKHNMIIRAAEYLYLTISQCYRPVKALSTTRHIHTTTCCASITHLGFSVLPKDPLACRLKEPGIEPLTCSTFYSKHNRLD